jgi:elongation factor 1 alpha-like protein
MSRHRNVRNMMEEDYYDDYDDYGDYDEYDDYAPAPVVKPKAAAAKNKGGAANKQQQGAAATNANKQKQTPTKGKQSATTKPAGVSVVKETSTPSSTSKAAPPPPPPTIPAVLLQERDKSEGARRAFTLVILGHVDAGKSTITGRLLYSGTSGKSSYRPPANYAWLLDEDEKEREHGITMDVAVKQFESPKNYNMVLQDAPGHADYVPAMITGTSSADGALLVVDATDQLKQNVLAQQLKEHIFLAKGLGISQVLVCLNKMDLLDWSKDMYETIQNELRKFLMQVGFSSNKVRFIPVSGFSGDNIVDAPTSEEAKEWYKGPTLLEALDDFDTPVQGKLLEKALRIILTDVGVGADFLGANKGVAVRAKVAQGWVQSGEALVVLPTGDDTTMQKLSSLHQSSLAYSTSGRPQQQEYAVAGETIDFFLTGVDVTRLSVGNIVVRAAQRPPLNTLCRAKIWVLDGLTIPIIQGAQAIYHMHHLDVPCHVSKLIRTLKKDGSVARERPRALTANTQAVVHVTLNHAIVMEAFSDCRALGRFVLRRGGDSIAVGRIEEVLSSS